MAKTGSARRHRQGPQAARMRGRSEATSLARCRAQIEHRLRDGRRIHRSHVRMHAAPLTRTAYPASRALCIRLASWARNECSSETRISRTNGTRLSGRSAPRSATHLLPITARLDCEQRPHRQRHRHRQPWRERPRQDSARGRRRRRHRGRSRHGSCPDRGTGAWQWAAKSAAHSLTRWRARHGNPAARIDYGAAAREVVARARRWRRELADATVGGQPHFPRSSPRSSSAVGVRRRQPGERDGGTGARARRTRPVRDRGRSRRQAWSTRPSRACWPGRRATVGRAL